VYTPTSSTDVLPTLLYVTEQTLASWAEGFVLPPFNSSYPDKDNRNIYSMRAKINGKYEPFTIATTTLIKNQYKLMYFFGYPELGAEGERVELYDIKNDPEELNDLSVSKRETTAELLSEMKQKLAEVNEPYR
jgi:arylsulfatase A-like enzyme